MDRNQRNFQIMEHIIRYCDEVAGTLDYFGENNTLRDNYIFCNALAKPIEEIGELATHLTEDFMAAHPEIPWKEIKGMRNWFAHQYREMDYETIWTAATEDVPELKTKCLQIWNERMMQQK